ncbi:esterase/lipase family protein [Coraliomargarita akajimensis]|uniref:Lipase, class 2 n=1 Tax=Coraliomargarita akajimensis (strain DSM 45221 / IAM 15411 / JCM 23193 / KCTC 12865 / 04OKA010-24) TaxID=583355 RepID=D5ELU8_CORAD|nr:alpha/beta fold hydrolase [Coraliomargarita akajimensis]ADE53273.1 lipase, class 2 [Coraliomargarita akajimensis DSM 45221]
MQVVFVHGIWDSGRVWRRMSTALTEAGHQCYCPDLVPANGANGLADLAHKLDSYITEQTDSEQPLVLVAFSMGTVIARYYLQELGGHQRCTHFFSISGPHRGTLMAHFWLGKAARDMRFGSRYLKRLAAGKSKLEQLTIHNYRTPFDLMIVPSQSNNWGLGQSHLVPALFHAWMLKHPRIPEHIASVLAE